MSHSPQRTLGRGSSLVVGLADADAVRRRVERRTVNVVECILGEAYVGSGY